MPANQLPMMANQPGTPNFPVSPSLEQPLIVVMIPGLPPYQRG